MPESKGSDGLDLPQRGRAPDGRPRYANFWLINKKRLARVPRPWRSRYKPRDWERALVEGIGRLTSSSAAS